MENCIEKRRSIQKLLTCSFVLVGAAYTKSLIAQNTTPAPVPRAFSEAGIQSWPQVSARLSILIPSIVRQGDHEVEIKSEIPVTQTMGLYLDENPVSRNSVDWSPRLIAKFSLNYRQIAQLKVSVRLQQSTRLILVTQNPQGWFMSSKQVHVGQAV